MPLVEVIVGSPSDLHFLWDSQLLGVLEGAHVSYSVSACSAHRNADELAEFIAKTRAETGVYVCAAGWAAALPGAVKALLLRHSLATVYGVALPSEEYPDALDAVLGITRLPPGVVVESAGKDKDGNDIIGVDAFNVIAAEVAHRALEYNPVPDPELLAQVVAKIKQPQFNIPRPPKED